jgi:hypoxanthine phosphoribosyltransferase
MPRRPLDTTRGVLEIDWPLFGELCRALAVKVAHDYDPEIVVGIAKAGVIPGAVIASLMQREFTAMTVTRKSASDLPTLVSGPLRSLRGRRVLVVDETCNTGHTLKLALNVVQSEQPKEVRTAVSFKTGPFQPDYHSFATEKAIILPWDREEIQDGELVPRTDYLPEASGDA